MLRHASLTLRVRDGTDGRGSHFFYQFRTLNPEIYANFAVVKLSNNTMTVAAMLQNYQKLLYETTGNPRSRHDTFDRLQPQPAA